MADKSPKQLLDRVRKNEYACGRWRGTDVLVIDEISMVSEDLIDKLDYIGRDLRGGSQPFGGIQIILCGDFFVSIPFVCLFYEFVPLILKKLVERG